MNTTKSKRIKPTEEVQNLLDILFKPDSKNNLIFKDLNTKLQDMDLRGVNLYKANLKKANLVRSNMHSAYLHEANLQNAILLDTNLQNANMYKANLQDAILDRADLQGANLQDACLLGTQINLITTNMPRNWRKVVRQFTNEDGEEEGPGANEYADEYEL